MYRNEDGDGRSRVSVVALPEAQPIDEADLVEPTGERFGTRPAG